MNRENEIYYYLLVYCINKSLDHNFYKSKSDKKILTFFWGF